MSEADVSLEDLRRRLTPEKEDDLSFVEPAKPSDLRALSDDELFRLLHKVAFANLWRISDKVQFEATARLIAALKDFKRSSDRAARRLMILTVVLVILTAVIVILTAVIVWLTAELE